MPGLAIALFLLAALGLVALAVQGMSLRRHLAEAAPRPRGARGISVLKPLCGVDDDLEGNLASFAALDWPRYEVLLGLQDERDPAAPLAHAAVGRWPERFRVVVQRAELGMNPKVSQLATLAAEASHDILVVSDSNVRVEPGYLAEIAARLDDPGVGLVTHLIAGVGERRMGALLENLHLAGGVAPAIVGAKRVAGRDVVMGKSMALRRADLDAMGGLESVKDVLAEDYVLGARVSDLLRKRVEIASRPIENVNREKTLLQFAARCRRWSVLQRHLVGLGPYTAQALLNPVFLATLGLAASPSPRAWGAWAAAASLRALLDGWAGRALRPPGFRPLELLAVPVKDLLLGLSWTEGFVRNTVDWRGRRLRVLSGTVLAEPRREARPVAPRPPSR
ncbi:MAG TPA: glycosyltransferase [Anaeromyxobacteraceae bacterium]|nr:glycosyltransferase [Anaeromyxobacteraceae bacterium]